MLVLHVMPEPHILCPAGVAPMHAPVPPPLPPAPVVVVVEVVEVVVDVVTVDPLPLPTPPLGGT
jgi:hypothetical protein